MLTLAGCHVADERPKFIKDIPGIKKNGNSQVLDAARASRDSLGLDNLEQGYDSLELRIWLSYKGKDTFQVLTIKENNHQWFGYFCQASYVLNPDGDSLSHYTQIVFQPKPRADWGEIVDSLVKLQIMTLPDMLKVMSINDLPFEGGNSVLIEVADAHQYRIYAYELPSRYKDSVKNAADVDKILNFLRERLGIKYLGSF